MSKEREGRSGVCTRDRDDDGTNQQPEEGSVAGDNVKISIIGTGPYRVDGAMELCDADGNRIETQDGKPFFLCRCGQSANKPFCDGTHNRTDWDPALAERG